MKESHNDLQRIVLEHVGRENYRPVKPKVIAKQLGIPEDELRDLKKVIKKLIKQGSLTYGSHHLVQKGAPRKEPLEIEGRFKRTSRGFGFVKPATEATLPIKDDIYVSIENSGDAADGDLVSIKLLKRRGPQGKRSGRIESIIERRTTTFVGTYSRSERGDYVMVDGNLFTTPARVGDATAKGAKPGDKVVIEMVRFPQPAVDGEAVITEVLGEHHLPGVDTLTIMREFGLPEEFPERVLEAGREEAAAFDETIPDNRDDLTDLTVITIDPYDARDFDDAISLERIENDHWRLGVHIADVSHFVRPNSAIDNEAYARATSVYLPDRVVPMIPEIISNGLASLQPDRVRFARTVFIELTPSGQCVSTEVRRSAIKSCKRLTYEEVDEFIESPESFRSQVTDEVFELLARMYELAMDLRQRRLGAGAVELSLPEVKIDMDEEGRVSGAHRVEHTESHQIIEEFMLAANVAVAESLVDRELFLLRRIHPNPSPRKLKDLTQFVKGLGITCGSLNSRFEIKRVLGEVEGEAIEHAVNLAVLRSMQKATYSPREEGHYALNADAYCHFTSPIRRYPDLVIHRMMDAIQDDAKPASDFGHLTRLGYHCSALEQRAEKAERELTKLKLINYLVDKIGMELDGRITGVESYGVFVEGTELPAEGLVPLESIGNDHYDFDSETRCLTGRRGGEILRLGDEVRVQIVSADPGRRIIDLARVVTGNHRSPGKNKKSRGGAGSPSSSKNRRSSSKAQGAGRKSTSGKKSKSKRRRK